ncbi:MAG: hypothetical protein H6709_22980 [Kofleriaceae bacterium]|nr:hypothetical protein [Myxococcales bacterium]MCB9563536.1 hypothetical protein [Kofleriaceae bacterium]MCB9574948.1 hypothetical protein [Kofleriaceae bacterium]
MKRLVAISALTTTVALMTVAAACGGKDKGATAGPGAGSDTGGGGSTLTKQEVISFGTQLATAADADPPKTRVWLGLTDETGASQSFPIDTFTGTCSAEEGGDMGALGTLRCWWAGAGVNLIAVARGAEVIVLRQWVEEQQDEPLDYEELQRIQVTYGAKVVFQL